MLKRIILQAAKRHPISVAVYTVYIVLWLVVCYLTYYYLVKVDPDTIQAIVFYWLLCACIPYFIVNIILSYYDKKHSSFYNTMARLVFLPIGLVILILITDAIVDFNNKGV
jgi:hypothetical protein